MNRRYRKVYFERDVYKAFSDLTYGEFFRFGKGNQEYMYINEYTYVSLKNNKSYKTAFDFMVVQLGYHYEY